MSSQTIRTKKNVYYYFLNFYTKQIVKRITRPGRDILSQRKSLEFFARFSVPPRGLTRESLRTDSFQGEWFIPTGADDKRVILYLHGGAFVLGSSLLYRELLVQLAEMSGIRILFLDYRLAPEHPYPAAFDDCLSAYSHLINNGYQAKNIAVCGDSAGGNLALILSILASEHELPKPACLACFSPFIDLSFSGDSITELGDIDPMLSIDWLREAAGHYLLDNDPKDFRVSPLFGGLDALPPVLVQVGSEELLLSDATRLEEKADAAGANLELEIWEPMWHVWQLYGRYLPQAKEALSRSAAFVVSHLAS